jgi:hypothetical protein
MSMFIVALRAQVWDQDGHMVQRYRSGLASASKGTGIVQCSQMLKDLRDGVRIPLERELLLKRRHQLPIWYWEHLGQMPQLIEYVDERAMAVNKDVSLLASVPLLLGLLQRPCVQRSMQLLLQIRST